MTPSGNPNSASVSSGVYQSGATGSGGGGGFTEFSYHPASASQGRLMFHPSYFATAPPPATTSSSQPMTWSMMEAPPSSAGAWPPYMYSLPPPHYGTLPPLSSDPNKQSPSIFPTSAEAAYYSHQPMSEAMDLQQKGYRTHHIQLPPPPGHENGRVFNYTTTANTGDSVITPPNENKLVFDEQLVGSSHGFSRPPPPPPSTMYNTYYVPYPIPADSRFCHSYVSNPAAVAAAAAAASMRMIPRSFDSTDYFSHQGIEMQNGIFRRPKRLRRKYEEIKRLFTCNWPGCDRSYGTLNNLNTHVRLQCHGPKRSQEEFNTITKPLQSSATNSNHEDSPAPASPSAAAAAAGSPSAAGVSQSAAGDVSRSDGGDE